MKSDTISHKAEAKSSSPRFVLQSLFASISSRKQYKTIIESSAIDLISFQKKLSAVFDKSTNKKRGDLHVDGQLWRYARHGLGVNFIRYCDLVSVDMEVDVQDPDKFSAWRLALYLESKGVYFEEALIGSILNKSKAFIAEGNFYRLKL